MVKRENQKMASYCPPRILQTAEVMLEVDLLAGPSNIGEVVGTGHERLEYDATDATANNGYSINDWLD